MLLSASVEGAAVNLAAAFEAEQAAVTGAVVSRSHAGFTGAGYVDYVHAAGDSIQWTVDVAAGGWHELTFRYASGSTSDRPLELKVNGAVVLPRVPFAPTGSWSAWRTVTVAAPFTAGANAVRLTAAGSSGPNVDSLTTRPAAPQTLQAESAMVEGPLVSRQHAGFTGTGYVDYQRATGDYVEWAVDALTAGDYALSIRYANGSTSDRPLELVVNGAAAASRVSFAPTGSWSAWRNASATVTLPRGVSRVRLASVGFNGANVDSLIVAPPAVTVEPIRLNGGVLTVDGGGGDDAITVTAEAGQIVATVGTRSQRFASGAVQRVDLYGHGGNDSISLGAGVPAGLLDGGDGNDGLWGGDYADTLRGGAGDDGLDGGGGDDLLDGGVGSDNIRGSDGIDTVDYSSRTVPVELTLHEYWEYDPDGSYLVREGHGILGDEVDSLSNVESANGGAAGDTFTGDSTNNTFSGGAGNDVMAGASGDDRLLGGDGNDRLDGGDGFDDLQGGAGNDTLLGGRDDDALTGGAGDDYLDGDEGDDHFDGGTGANTVVDPVDSVAVISGVLRVTATNADEVISVTQSGATLTLHRTGAAASFPAASITSIWIDGLGGNDTLRLGNADGSALPAVPARLSGSGGDDTLFGGPLADTLSGGAGFDTLDGGVGADAISGGGGVDTVDYSRRTAAVTILLHPAWGGGNSGEADEGDPIADDVEVGVGGSGNDVMNGGGGTTFYGGLGNDTITVGEGGSAYGGPGDDDLSQGWVDEGYYISIGPLHGGPGNDTLHSEEYADGPLFGEEGDDRFELQDHSGSGINGGPGRDFASASGFYDHPWQFNAAGTGVEIIVGSYLNDELVGDAFTESIDGREGDDLITGGPADETLIGGEGADTVRGGGGNDRLVEGTYASGPDFLSGGDGVDTLDYSGRTVGVRVIPNGVADDGEGGEFPENDNVQEDIENVTGGAGNDVITGTDANNRLTGNGGDDALTGGLGKDQLRGNAGNDTLFARDGGVVDFLDGGSGTDKAERDDVDFAQYVESFLE